MTKHVLNLRKPDFLDFERMHANGAVPQSTETKRIADGLNHVACLRKKFLAAVFFNPGAPVDFTGTPGSPTERCSGRFHVGPATTQIRIRWGLCTVDTTGTSYMPAVWLYLNGADTDKAYFGDYNASHSSFWIPNETSHQTTYVTLTPDTDYTWTIRGQHGARLLYMTVSEVESVTADDSVGVITNPAPYLSEGPILASHVTDLITANNSLVKRAGAHLLCHNTHETPNTSSASYVTAWGSEAQYLTLETQYKDTNNRDIDVLFCVDGKLSAAGSGGARLVDDGASVLAELTSFTAVRAWHTLQTTITATADRQVKFQIKGDGTRTLTVYGWGLYIYDP